MEHLALDEAQRALDRAISSAPDWAAAHYEQGKLHLRRENMEAACASFAEATRLMPGFSPAFSNLGATLGELDRPEEALDALERARALDPFGVQVINNIGVVTRELGRLAESEAALRDVVALSPDFVFGHYNLGHTLFLAGRFDAAVDAYREGQRRDPTRNPVQASRLAFARLAAGDPTSALDELGGALGRVDPDRRAQLVADSQEMAAALRGWRHDLPGLDAVDRLLANG
jgi:tetratricopeptide (TPR) repeat protein